MTDSNRKKHFDLENNKPQFSHDEKENPNVDFELLREFQKLSRKDCPFSKGANYSVESPFGAVHVSEFQFAQSTVSPKKNK